MNCFWIGSAFFLSPVYLSLLWALGIPCPLSVLVFQVAPQWLHVLSKYILSAIKFTFFITEYFPFSDWQQPMGQWCNWQYQGFHYFLCIPWCQWRLCWSQINDCIQVVLEVLVVLADLGQCGHCSSVQCHAGVPELQKQQWCCYNNIKPVFSTLFLIIFTLHSCSHLIYSSR